MLVFEVPLPIRRSSLGIEIFLPGATVSTSSLVQLALSAPDVMPTLQFDPRSVITSFGPCGISAALAALLTERRIVVIGATVQQLVETCELLLTLLYPFSWEMPYIPVLPVHLASDCMSNPVPFLYGILSSYAVASLEELSHEDTGDVVVVDAVAGFVEVGATRYLERNSVASASGTSPPKLTRSIDEQLRFPDPLGGEFLVELEAVDALARASPAVGDTAGAAQLTSTDLPVELQVSLCVTLAVSGPRH